MKLLAIDAGTNESACLLMKDDGIDVMKVEFHAILPNDSVIRIIEEHPKLVIIEEVSHMGMPVGRDVFETVRWSGRFEQVARYRGGVVQYIPRMRIKLNLCGNARAKDPNIRQALIDRYGGTDKAIGGKKCLTCKGKGWRGRFHDPCTDCHESGWRLKKGALYGITSHSWSALAVAVTYLDESRIPAGS
jgi:hypothetical protein|tara:strand:+ start:560 stop:1126 length:567 start_codon:yes stop_codon:yes gene_type:complete